MLQSVKNAWGNFKEYWNNNLAENYKTVSKAFGAYLIATATAIGNGLTNYVTTGAFGWAGFSVMMVGASTMFVTILITSIFGKEEEEKE